ncbi:MAG: DUF6268 family outer membrane beta-barrel protein [Flammeovirgaceae bacterium]
MSQQRCILWCFFCLLLGIDYSCCAQQATDSTKTKRYFDLKPKLASFSLTSIRSFAISGSSEHLGNADAEINENRRRDAFLRFPIYMKNKWLVGLGLVYRHEQFTFDDADQINYALYKRLEDKGLRRTGLDVFFKRSYTKRRSLTGSFSIRLNGDTYHSASLYNFLKISLIAAYSKKKNDRTEIGWGLVGGYDLGTPLVYPLFIYKHHFNSHLQVDLNLPKRASLLYGFSDKMFLSATAEISGASYHIDDNILKDFGSLEIRKSEFRAKLRLDREIHDWLWFGAECGVVKYINFFVSEPAALRDDAIINLNPDHAHFFKFSIFMVPPKKIYDVIR